MKKYLIVLLGCGFLLSCGPKRMSCYGKRCVEHTPKADLMKTKPRNS